MQTPDAWIEDNGRVYVNARKHELSFAYDGDNSARPVWFWDIEPPEESEAPTFEKDLEHLLNKHSIDAKLNLPDYEVAKWVMNFLEVFEDGLNSENRG